MIDQIKKYIAKNDLKEKVLPAMSSDTGLVVVIPVFLEPDLLSTLKALKNCVNTIQKVEVLLVFNAQLGDDENKNKQIVHAKEINEWCQINSTHLLDIHVLEVYDLPKKHFGAGLARRIGMDEAVLRFNSIANENGVIVCLDADCLVAENYLLSLENYFSEEKNMGCSIYFEHPLEGSLNSELYEAITLYELHLRYYVEALRYVGFPEVVHTVGSAMAMRVSNYVRSGGMPRKQAGEDFYLIQKLIPMGGFGELNSTTVYPSPRISNRVPFGTGPSIRTIIESEDKSYESYNLQAFIDLKKLFDNIDVLYKISEENYQSFILELPGRVRSFLVNLNFWDDLIDVNENSSTVETYRKRFYSVFNAFKVVKYLNYVHDNFIGKTDVFDCAIELMELLEVDVDTIFEVKELLMCYRQRTRN